MFNHVISDISVVLRKTTLTISDSIDAVSPVETEIVGVVSLSTTKKQKEKKKKKKRKTDLKKPNLQGRIP